MVYSCRAPRHTVERELPHLRRHGPQQRRWMVRIPGLRHKQCKRHGRRSVGEFRSRLPEPGRDECPAILGVRQTYFGTFVQDDWKVSRKLTLNLGLRWDVDVPYSEVNSRITSVDLNK